MEMMQGALGFTIPVPSQKQTTNLTLTPEAILSWRNHLPMADTGKTASQVFHALNDCNQVNLPPKQRFEILELFRTPVQFICQSLRKHYINQMNPLTETQLTIAHLAETLQLEMAVGYKIIIEQSQTETSKEFIETIIPTSIERLFHYFDHVLLRCYQLYSLPNEAVWREVHLLFEYVQNKKYLKDPKILNAYKGILLMSLTDPYKWRQSEQDTLHEACAFWVNDIEIRKHPTTGDQTVNEDKSSRTPTEQMRFLDLTKLITRIKNVINTLEPNELQIKILHSNEPEYLVPISVLQTIISTWEKKSERGIRVERSINVEICTGLSACHYYLNEEKPFMQQGLGTASDISSPIALAEAIELTSIPVEHSATLEAKKFPLYSCLMANEGEQGGAGLIWQEKGHPPLQPGEIICIRTKTQENNGSFSVAVIRWMKHASDNELRIGIQNLSKTAKAAALQIIKEGQNSGYFLRCLIFDNQIITPILPFKAGARALLAEELNDTPIKIELLKLVQSTSSYKIFHYSAVDKAVDQTITEASINAIPSTGTTKDDTRARIEDPAFDSIWSKL